MKKLFTLLSLVMLFASTVCAADYRRTWDFREGWSEMTLGYLAGDTDNWQVPSDNNTGFNNKVTMSGTIKATYNGVSVVIPELEGITFGSTRAKRIQVWTGAQKNTSFPDSPCLWINGKSVNMKVTVPAGENVKFGYCSHSATEARGFKVSGGFADIDGNTSFTSKADATIHDVELINSNATDAELTITSTNGAHLYYIIIGAGDVPKQVKVGYLYYDAAGGGFETLPLYTAVTGMENFIYEGVNLSSKIPTKEELMAYDAVVLDGSIPAEADIVSALLPNIYWQPVANFNPALQKAFGFGEPLTPEMEIVWASDVKDRWFTGFEAWAMDGAFGISNGSEMPVPVKLSAAHANIDKRIVAGSDAFAYPDSVVAYTYNTNHNSYTYYGLAGDYAAGTEMILQNVLTETVNSKADISACVTPAIKVDYAEMVATVTLSNLNKNAKIYYTIDGTNPTTASQQYTEPIVLNAEKTVKAVAIADGYTLSDITSLDVKMFHQAKVPVISKTGDNAKEDAVISIASEDGDKVQIWYNFTGSSDTAKSSKYVAPVTIKRAAVVTAFAIGVVSGADTLVQSETVSDSIMANMLNVRRDEVAHFRGSGWDNVTDLVLDGVPMTAWANSKNYFFSWGKSAKLGVENGDPIVDGQGNPVLDENGNIQFEQILGPVSVTTNNADPDWKITSRGQVMIYQGNTVGYNIADFTGYNPERAEDYHEQLATTGCIQFGGVASGDTPSATIETTNAYAGPFNVVAIVANVNGNKTTGVANPCKVAFQISTDGKEWKTLNDTLTTASIYRNYNKFELSYNEAAPVYVRLASISGSSQAVHDIYVFNHGVKSAAEEDAYTGVDEVVAPEAATVKTAKYVKNGRIVIVSGGKEYSVSGVMIK